MRGTDRSERRPAWPEDPGSSVSSTTPSRPKDGCAERHRLGPYDTREQAERAVDSVAEREQKLTAEDRAWEGD